MLHVPFLWGPTEVCEVMCWPLPPALLGRCSPRDPPELPPSLPAGVLTGRVMAAAVFFSAACFLLLCLGLRKAQGSGPWPIIRDSVSDYASVSHISKRPGLLPMCLGQFLQPVQ